MDEFNSTTSVHTVASAGPYAQAAALYFDAGWHGVLPIAHKTKHGKYVDAPGKSWPPGGYTGAAGAYPTREQVAAWIAAKGHLNLGLRLPRAAGYEVIGIDHDAYKVADTLENLCQLEAQWLGPDGAVGTGSLPATCMSTARSDGESCIRFYRVPPGLTWHDPGEGVEIIRPAHRFAVVWPSVHPDVGAQYTWYRGERPVPEAKLDRVPAPDELPWLPASWVAVLTGPASGTTRAAQSTSGSSVGVSTRAGERVDAEAILRGELAGYATEREALTSLLGSVWWNFPHADAAKSVLWTAAQRFNTGTTPLHRPEDPWTPEEVARLVDTWHEGKESRDLSQGSAAWAVGSLAPEEAARLPESVIEALVRERSTREARRLLDDEEAAEARGERPKRTAREFASVPPPPRVLGDILGVGPNGVAGPSEAGKSLWVRDLVLEIAASGRAVLAVLSEGTHDFEERWASQPLWEAAADRVFVLDEPVDLVRGDDVDWLLREYARERPVAVLFDVIYDMGMADDNGMKDVIPVFRSLKRISKEWDAATIAVGHPGLNTDQRRFRGSSMWRQLFVTEYHMGDGRFTCEKSKLADRRRLAANYRAEYPKLTWLSAGEVVSAEATRRVTIQQYIAQYPGLSQREYGRRLAAQLGVSESRARGLIAEVQGGA